MNSNILLKVVLLTLALMIGLIASAEASNLNKYLIDKFIKDFPDYARIVRQAGLKAEKAQDYMSAQSAARGIKVFLQKRGWTSQQFSEVGTSIFKAYAALEQQKARKQGLAQLNDPQIQEALKNPSLTPEQRAMLKKNLEQARQAYSQPSDLDVPPEDLKLVAPYAPQIRAMLEGLDLDE